MSQPWTIYESPLGPLTLVGGPGGLRGLYFPGRSAPLAERDRNHGRFSDAAHQLEEYFTGTRRRFDLPLDLGGTPFQRKIWGQLSSIPYGATRSYTRWRAPSGGPSASAPWRPPLAAHRSRSSSVPPGRRRRWRADGLSRRA